MIRPPFMARVAAGVAVTAYEETLKLPTTMVTLPMTAVSQVLQTTMRVQQSINTLAIKGDRLFDRIYRSEQEQPEWAVFDEDVDETSPARDTGGEVDVPDNESSTNPGRFALYSSPLQADEQTTASDPAPSTAAPEHTVSVPDIAEDLDYGSLTLAQLRARLRTLSVEDLTALLEYENATLSRAPFQTMLANRITTASAK